MRVRFPWFTLYARPRGSRTRCLAAMLAHEALHLVGLDPHRPGTLGWRQTVRYQIGVPTTYPHVGHRGEHIVIGADTDPASVPVIDGALLFRTVGVTSGGITGQTARGATGALSAVYRGNGATGAWESMVFVPAGRPGNELYYGGEVTGAGGSTTIDLPHNSYEVNIAEFAARIGAINFTMQTNRIVGWPGDATFTRHDLVVTQSPGVIDANPPFPGFDSLGVQGTPSASPQDPPVDPTMIVLARVIVPPNASDSSECTIVDLREFGVDQYARRPVMFEELPSNRFPVGQAGRGLLTARDDGSGNFELVAILPDNKVRVLATEVDSGGALTPIEQDGPPAQGQNEIFGVFYTTPPTTGTFHFILGGVPTADLPYNATGNDLFSACVAAWGGQGVTNTNLIPLFGDQSMIDTGGELTFQFYADLSESAGPGTVTGVDATDGGLTFFTNPGSDPTPNAQVGTPLVAEQDGTVWTRVKQINYQSFVAISWKLIARLWAEPQDSFVPFGGVGYGVALFNGGSGPILYTMTATVTAASGGFLKAGVGASATPTLHPISDPMTGPGIVSFSLILNVGQFALIELDTGGGTITANDPIAIGIEFPAEIMP